MLLFDEVKSHTSSTSGFAKDNLCHPWANNLVKYNDTKLFSYCVFDMSAWFLPLSFTEDTVGQLNFLF